MSNPKESGIIPESIVESQIKIYHALRDRLISDPLKNFTITKRPSSIHAQTYIRLPDREDCQIDMDIKDTFRKQNKLREKTLKLIILAYPVEIDYILQQSLTEEDDLINVAEYDSITDMSNIGNNGGRLLKRFNAPNGYLNVPIFNPNDIRTILPYVTTGEFIPVRAQKQLEANNPRIHDLASFFDI